MQPDSSLEELQAIFAADTGSAGARISLIGQSPASKSTTSFKPSSDHNGQSQLGDISEESPKARLLFLQRTEEVKARLVFLH
jgi:hypothetical protein